MNITNRTINFKGINNLPNSEDKKTTKEYIKMAISDLIKDAERMVPENGKYTPLSAYIEVTKKNNTARIAIEHDPINPKTQRVLNIGVYKNGTDKIHSRYPISGTKKEIINYLSSKDAPAEIYKHIKELSDKVDKSFE